jgi:hypothetical protein
MTVLIALQENTAMKLERHILNSQVVQTGVCVLLASSATQDPPLQLQMTTSWELSVQSGITALKELSNKLLVQLEAMLQTNNLQLAPIAQQASIVMSQQCRLLFSVLRAITVLQIALCQLHVQEEPTTQILEVLLLQPVLLAQPNITVMKLEW